MRAGEWRRCCVIGLKKGESMNRCSLLLLKLDPHGFVGDSERLAVGCADDSDEAVSVTLGEP